jgi:hypothetical protein
MTIAATRWATWLSCGKSHPGCGIILAGSFGTIEPRVSTSRHVYREVWYFKAKSTRSDIREGFTCSDCSLEYAAFANQPADR